MTPVPDGSELFVIQADAVLTAESYTEYCKLAKSGAARDAQKKKKD